MISFLFVHSLTFASANPSPYPYGGRVSPDRNTCPPKIEVIQTGVDQKHVFILFEVSVGYSLTAYSTYLSEVYYTVDWSDENYYLYRFYNPDTHIHDLKQRTGMVKNVTLTDVPEGSHTVTIFAVEEGGYLRDRLTYGFSMTAEYLFNFTVDTVPQMLRRWIWRKKFTRKHPMYP